MRATQRERKRVSLLPGLAQVELSLIFLGCPFTATCLWEGDFGLLALLPNPCRGDLGRTWRTGDMSSVFPTDSFLGLASPLSALP